MERPVLGRSGESEAWIYLWWGIGSSLFCLAVFIAWALGAFA